MKIAASASLLLLVFLMKTYPQTPVEFAEIWDKQHISKIFPSDVRHKDLQNYLEDLKKLGIKVEEVGRSNANRDIYQMEFGTGKTRVFLWSQMHGDEPTATSALIDMFAFLQTNRDLAWVKKIENELTIRSVPMLNPDGAETYQRRNLQGIDINRDAIDLKTPEARLLKKLRDDWSPNIGFNLHNQNALTAAGRSGKQAAISLLVVFGDGAKTTNDGLERNKRIASAVVMALKNFIPDNIGRYDDGYAPTAFGDNFTAWGTPVILIETGALRGKDEMYLVKLNFVAFLTAMRTIADGSEKKHSSDAYEQLPKNTSGQLYSFIFRNGSIIDQANPDRIAISSIGVNTDRRRASFAPTTFIRNVGPLYGVTGLEEYDASKFYVIQRFGKLKSGELAELFFYKIDRKVDWKSEDMEKQFPPDAVFSTGKWTKGEGVVPKR